MISNVYIYYGSIKKDKIRNIIIDCSVVDSFSVPHITEVPVQDSFLITFYKTELSTENLLEKLKIDDMKYRYSFYGKDTISATKELYEFLNDKVPYLISMISPDLSKLVLDDIKDTSVKEQIQIPDPVNEPVIGVIDTLFAEQVYFHNWVENIDYLGSAPQPRQDKQQKHKAKQSESGPQG